jgi:iron complex transport system substrate-binding protein
MGSRVRFICAAFAAVLLATSAATGETSGTPGHDPSRIVSIGGAVTEILYALGLQQRVVAVDTTSLYPPDVLQTKPNVGYMRQLSPEGVLGLNPSLILAIDGSGPPNVMAVIESAGIPWSTYRTRSRAKGLFRRSG